MYFDFFASGEIKRIKADYPKVLSCEETVERILAGASIARFGDGEFKLLLGSRLHFQSWSPCIVKRLRDVLLLPQNRCLVGIIDAPAFDVQPQSFAARYRYFFARLKKDLLGQKMQAAQKLRKYSFYDWFWLCSWLFLKKYLKHKEYANALVSRLAVFQSVPLDKIKKIWDGRNVVFVVPKNGHFIFEERLFGNMQSVDYIYIEPADAWKHYGQTLQESLQHSKDRLFMLAAGPTATVLAFDLAQQGYQALDIGHLSNCYLEFLGEAPPPESLPSVCEKNEI
ncbi:hypothetical protein FACS189419_08290 [Planctomycetales bacterium]|nr:hypothetical protein FACS189419_08290 [Planctomycetales bacterium]